MSDKEKLAENLMTFLPMMHKKFMKSILSCGIPRQHLELLFRLKKEDGKLMSYYSEKMLIPKPNLTVLADRLIKEDLIERVSDPCDRRAIILKITDKGKEYLEEYKGKARLAMVKKLNSLSSNDITRLNELMDEMKAIFDKWNDE